ncbi:soluble inorganic [Cyclospora cayetanensis]|uniref:inorganic diphosphatase n=1 Tax=Cyclospora cayetanensis TaxID=88456 RepID=A0A1D3CTF0_9EIME|nr:soluble inorganic [Cyclospora cayetanensis]
MQPSREATASQYSKERLETKTLQSSSRDSSSLPLVQFVAEISCGSALKNEIRLQEAFNPIRQDRHKDEASPLSVCRLFARAALAYGMDIRLTASHVIGALALIDSGEVDYKILVVSASSPFFSALHSPTDLQILRPGFLDTVKDWFRRYKVGGAPGGPSKENTFGYGGAPLDAAAAWRMIQEAHERPTPRLAPSWEPPTRGKREGERKGERPFEGKEANTEAGKKYSPFRARLLGGPLPQMERFLPSLCVASMAQPFRVFVTPLLSISKCAVLISARDTFYTREKPFALPKGFVMLLEYSCFMECVLIQGSLETEQRRRGNRTASVASEGARLPVQQHNCLLAVTDLVERQPLSSREYYQMQQPSVLISPPRPHISLPPPLPVSCASHQLTLQASSTGTTVLAIAAAASATATGGAARHELWQNVLDAEADRPRSVVEARVP